MIELKCETCGKKFMRRESEAKRNAERGMRIFCSRSCRGKKIYGDTPLRRRVGYKYLPKKELDELSPFRPHLKSIKCHAKKINKQVFISLEDLKNKWDEQEGKCVLTGWSMVNYQSTRIRPARSPERASVDRIDSLKDYTIDNIRFICMMAQFAKNDFNDAAVINFCEAVVQKRMGG